MISIINFFVPFQSHLLYTLLNNKHNIYTSVMSLLYKTITRVYIIHQCQSLHLFNIFFCSLTLLVLSIITSTMMLYSTFSISSLVQCPIYIILYIYVYIQYTIFYIYTKQRMESLWQKDNNSKKYHLFFSVTTSYRMTWNKQMHNLYLNWTIYTAPPWNKTFVYGCRQ